jgi:hypothetical protein
MREKNVKICDVEVVGKSGTESIRKQNLSLIRIFGLSSITPKNVCRAEKRRAPLHRLYYRRLSHKPLRTAFHCVFHLLYFRLLPRQLNQISADADFFVFMGS